MKAIWQKEDNLLKAHLNKKKSFLETNMKDMSRKKRENVQ